MLLSAVGLLWFAAWLFAVGIAQAGLWKAVLALVIWPYFIGVLGALMERIDERIDR